MKQIFMYTLAELPAVVQELKELLFSCDIVALTGPLGAGKTSLVKELLKAYGIKERVTSPTFTYVQQYENDEGYRFYHFDLYRIASERDFTQAGFQEYLYQPNSMAIIEWPEAIESLLGERVCRIEMGYHEDSNKRILEIST